jgi:hypothetical protein
MPDMVKLLNSHISWGTNLIIGNKSVHGVAQKRNMRNGLQGSE